MPEFTVQSVEELIAESRRQNELPASPAPDSRVQINRISITHEAIMDWLIANPGKGQMKECAATFGITRAWLSSLVWSDAFQARLRDKQEQAFEGTIVELRDKVTGVAHAALDRLGEKIDYVEDPKALLDTADKMLHRLGYAPKTGGEGGGNTNNTQNNFYAVSPALLAQAREAAKTGAHNAQLPLPPTEGVQTIEDNHLGQTLEGSPSVRNESSEEAEARGEVSGVEVRGEGSGVSD